MYRKIPERKRDWTSSERLNRASRFSAAGLRRVLLLPIAGSDFQVQRQKNCNGFCLGKTLRDSKGTSKSPCLNCVTFSARCGGTRDAFLADTLGPVVRYTHWAADPDNVGSRTKRNQVDRGAVLLTH